MALTPAIYEPSTNEAFLFLLTISPADGSTPIRVVNDNVDLVSRGDTFIGYPFDITLPPDTGDRKHQLTLQIDNVDQQIVNAVRALEDPPTVKLELVLSGSPNTVEKTVDFLRLDSAEYDAMTVTAQLRPENMLARQFPSETYNPVEWRDLFY